MTLLKELINEGNDNKDNISFMKQTAKDYDVSLTLVKKLYDSNHTKFYANLEKHLAEKK